MANLLKEQKKELLTKAFDENPDLAKGKKLCGIVVLLWILTRALHLAAELVLAFTIDIAILSATNIAALVIVILFSIGIYNGTKAFAILPIIGGAIMPLTKHVISGLKLSPVSSSKQENSVVTCHSLLLGLEKSISLIPLLDDNIE